MPAEDLVEFTRGGRRESVHQGHIAVCTADGRVVDGWGDAHASILPRSAAKMLQALPLVESGAAAAHGLKTEHLALACASHMGAEIHTGPVQNWLASLGLGDDALRCGPQPPADPAAARALAQAGKSPCQWHNNCSGKHTGFLTLGAHLRAGPDYAELDHPVQRAVHAAWQEVTGEETDGYGIDGCSAPNHVTTLSGLAAAMAQFATAETRSGTRAAAQVDLVSAMMAHPDLVAGEGRACTEFMRAMAGRGVVKTGAEGVFTAILPALGLGVALKIVDGATRASEAVMAALLVHLGILEATHPVVLRRVGGPITNWRGLEVGQVRAVFPRQAKSAAE